METIIVNARTNSVAKDPLEGAQAGNFEEGSLLIINCSATDEWEITEGEEAFEVNADGMSGRMHATENQRFRVGALVGSLDGGNSFFAVGTRLEMKVLTDGGTLGTSAPLTLYCWDSDYVNNSGTIRAYVTSVPASVFEG